MIQDMKLVFPQSEWFRIWNCCFIKVNYSGYEIAVSSNHIKVQCTRLTNVMRNIMTDIFFMLRNLNLHGRSLCSPRCGYLRGGCELNVYIFILHLWTPVKFHSSEHYTWKNWICSKLKCVERRNEGVTEIVNKEMFSVRCFTLYKNIYQIAP